jgi:hypothetical protein
VRTTGLGAQATTGVRTQEETTTGCTQGAITFGQQLAVTDGRKHDEPIPLGMQDEPQVERRLQLELATQLVLEAQPLDVAQLEAADEQVTFIVPQLVVPQLPPAEGHPQSLLKDGVAE